MHRYIPIISTKMSNKRENNIVRLSGSARNLLASNKDEKIELWNKLENSSLVLPVKPAYRADIKKVKEETGIKLKDVIFVSSNVKTMLGSDDNNSSIWADKEPRKCAIGSDPEMLIMTINGNIIYASNVID